MTQSTTPAPGGMLTALDERLTIIEKRLKALEEKTMSLNVYGPVRSEPHRINSTIPEQLIKELKQS